MRPRKTFRSPLADEGISSPFTVDFGLGSSSACVGCKLFSCPLLSRGSDSEGVVLWATIDVLYSANISS